mmetsp:Transcript_1060/g.3796  ORF Transcript_1060/g.3796 Transcript_1060/m.3796 type:complete len:81 (-) Transcript_1060:395-637(-)
MRAQWAAKKCSSSALDIPLNCACFVVSMSTLRELHHCSTSSQLLKAYAAVFARRRFVHRYPIGHKLCPSTRRQSRRLRPT